VDTPKLTIGRSRPLQRHLRRSLSLRSLNFLHGLPQVSSRTGRTPAGYASFAGLAVLHEASTRGRFWLQLCPFLLAFCAGAAQRRHNRGSPKFTSAAPVHHRTKLLIFTAGLMRQFRFVATVTVLQQRIHGSWWGTGRHRRPAGATQQQRPGITQQAKGRQHAEELGKRWRFFPTYAEV
jgi:hypothetical protein